MVIREGDGFRGPDDSPKAQFSQKPLVFSGGSAEQTHQDTAWMDYEVFIHGCLTKPPEGLGLPGIRSGDVVSPFKNGVIQTSDWYEPRSITLTVEVSSDGCARCDDFEGVRGKVRRIAQVLTRFAPGADNLGDRQEDNFWMLIFPDCHDPDLICTQDQEWSGPYALYGRPRIIGTTWHRSNENRATMIIQFDAMDHRLILPCLDLETDPDTFFPWRYSQCADALSPGSGAFRVNHAPDPTQRATAWVGADSTATITRPDSASLTNGPHGQGYAQFEITVAATSSPFYWAQTGSGSNGIPVEPGQFWTLSAYWWASVLVGTQRMAANLFREDGSYHSSVTAGASDIGIPSAEAWHRAWGPLEIPADVYFMQPATSWSGGSDYPVGFIGRNADFLAERDFNATTLGEVAPPHWYFNGDYYGEWSGTADASASLTTFQRRNMAIAPRGDNVTAWVPVAAGGTFTESLISGITDFDAPLVVPGTPDVTTAVRYTQTAPGTNNPEFINIALQSRQGAYHEESAGERRFHMMVSVRVDQPGLSAEARGYVLTDGGSIFADSFGPSDPLTPGVWQHRQLVGNANRDAVGFSAGVEIQGNPPNGTNIDVTATYVAAEEFYEQPDFQQDWFDSQTPIAEAATELGDLGGSAISWTLSADNPDGMTVLGTQCVWPIIEINGPFSPGLEIRFMFNGQEFGYRILKDLTDPNDFDSGTIFTKNGVFGVGSTWDFNSEMEFIGSPFPVGPGPVDFSVIPASPDDTGTVSICWQNSVVGA